MTDHIITDHLSITTNKTIDHTYVMIYVCDDDLCGFRVIDNRQQAFDTVDFIEQAIEHHGNWYAHAFIYDMIGNVSQYVKTPIPINETQARQVIKILIDTFDLWDIFTGAKEL